MIKAVSNFVLLFFKYAMIASLSMAIFSCKNGGIAPSVEEGQLVSIVVGPDNQYVAKSSSFQLVAYGTFENGTTRTLVAADEINWVVDDTTIASISSSGLLTNTWAGGSNNATRILNVTATAKGISDAARLTVVSASISSIIINPTNLTVAPNNQVNFTVIANLSDGSTLDVTQSSTITITNTAVATVSNGVVSGVAVGTTTLTATYSSRTVNTTVAVSDGASSGGSTSGTGLKGDYYDGTNFETFFGTRTDATVNFSWNADVNNLGQTENFSIRWTGFIQAEKSETYTFYTRADDGTRLSINGVAFASCIDDWTLHGVTERTCATTFNLTAGQKIAVTLEYFEGPGVSQIQLLWSSPTTTKAVIPQQFLYPE